MKGQWTWTPPIDGQINVNMDGLFLRDLDRERASGVSLGIQEGTYSVWEGGDC